MFRIIYDPAGSSDPHARSRGEIMPGRVCRSDATIREARSAAAGTHLGASTGRPTLDGRRPFPAYIQEYTHATHHTHHTPPRRAYRSPPHTACTTIGPLPLEQRNDTLDPSALRAPHRSAALFTTALGGSVSRLSFGERFRAAPPSPPHPCPPPPTLVHSLELEP